MRVKTKKKDSEGVTKLDCSGELKEVIIKEDIFYPNNNLIELCFKKENNSGIVELSVEEIEKINEEIKKNKSKNSKNIKVMKFKK
jgi:hypothetical protein